MSSASSPWGGAFEGGGGCRRGEWGEDEGVSVGEEGECGGEGESVGEEGECEDEGVSARMRV